MCLITSYFASDSRHLAEPKINRWSPFFSNVLLVKTAKMYFLPRPSKWAIARSKRIKNAFSMIFGRKICVFPCLFQHCRNPCSSLRLRAKCATQALTPYVATDTNSLHFNWRSILQPMPDSISRANLSSQALSWPPLATCTETLLHSFWLFSNFWFNLIFANCSIALKTSFYGIFTFSSIF